MTKLVILIGLFTLFIQGCALNKRAYRLAELSKVSACYKSWKYEDLKTVQHIRVLHFDPKSFYDISSFPSFTIGVNAKGDTIAIMDQDFEGILKQGDNVDVLPKKWSVLDKEFLKPLLPLSKKPSENDLYCSISIVFFGQIKR